MYKRFGSIRSDEVSGLLRFLTGSLGEFLDQRFQSDKLKRLILSNSLYGKHGGPYQPGTAMGLLFHLLSGVTLANDEVVDAKLVVSNADPKRTFLGLVEENDLSADFRRDIENIRMDGPGSVIARRVLTPPDLEAQFGNTEGNIFYEKIACYHRRHNNNNCRRCSRLPFWFAKSDSRKPV